MTRSEARAHLVQFIVAKALTLKSPKNAEIAVQCWMDDARIESRKLSSLTGDAFEDSFQAVWAAARPVAIAEVERRVDFTKNRPTRYAVRDNNFPGLYR